MLHTISFHASLLGRQLDEKIKSTNAHVLIYGAIEVHAMGNMGCIASNELIGKETGMTKNTVAKCISQIAKAGWVSVKLNKTNHRLSITPLLEIQAPPLPHGKPPFTGEKTPLYHTVNIDNILDNNEILSAEAEEEDFDSVSYIETMTENTQKHIRLIGFFFQEKGFKFDTKAQVQESIKANVAVARTLTKIFSTEDIRRAILWSKEVCPDSWTIHTMKKGLTTNKSKVDNYKLYD